MPSRGKARVGCVGGHCQQLLGGKFAYCQQPDAEIKTSLVFTSHPHSCRLCCSRHCTQLSPGTLVRGNLTNKETQEATRAAGNIPIGPPNPTDPVETCTK